MAADGTREDSIDPLEDRTRQIPPSPHASPRPLLLERIEPSLGRGERTRLDASRGRVRLGRGEDNEVRLYTASASREHAVIEGNELGEWRLTPAPGKSVWVDGEETTAPVILEVGLNLVMGGDHLRCVNEGLARDEGAAQTGVEAFRDEVGSVASLRGASRMTPFWWVVSGLALLGLGLILFALFEG